MKRIAVTLSLSAPAKDYGHWWFEIGDPYDPLSESFGWWPSRPVSPRETLLGVTGCLNGAGVFDGGTDFRNPPPRDPHHGDLRPNVKWFHPYVSQDDPRTDAEIVDCLRQFAQTYSGEWRWTLGWGQNCHTFQKLAFAHCQLFE